MGRAQDRLGAQPEILTDPVDSVHDVVADLQVGERYRNALLDGAQFHAFGRLPVDLAIAEHVQAQSRDREPRFDVALIDEHHAAARHPRRAADERRRARLPEMQKGSAAFDGQVRGAQHLSEARRTGRDERDGFARFDPSLHALEEHRDLPIEVFDRARFEHERFERTRDPGAGRSFDRARDDQRPPRGQGRAEGRKRRMRPFDFCQQRLADGVLVDAQFARFDRGEQHLFLARAFVFEAALDRGEHRRLLEHDERVLVEIVEQRLLAIVREREPRFGNVGAACDVGSCGRNGRRGPADALEHALAVRFVAPDLAPGGDLELFERLRASLRGKLKASDRFDTFTEKLHARRRLGRGRPKIDDPAPNRVFAGCRDDVGAMVTELVEPFLQRVEAEFSSGLEAEGRLDEHVARHHELAQCRNRRDRNPNASRRQVREEGHACAALRGALDDADALLARAHEGHVAPGVGTEIVRQIGERALGDVCGRHDDEHRPAQRAKDARVEVRPRRLRGFVQREGRAVHAQTLEQPGQRPAGTRERANERRGERSDERLPLLQHERQGQRYAPAVFRRCDHVDVEEFPLHGVRQDR